MAVTNFGTGASAFRTSPGVTVREFSARDTVPAVPTTIGAIGGVFRWGPVGVTQLVQSERDLVKYFGKPTAHNPETFFTAASFLAYSNQLYVSRAANTTSVLSAVANTGEANLALHVVKNEDHYETQSASFESDVHYIAKYPGDLGNSLRVSVCDSANQYSSNVDLRSILSNTSFNDANTKIELAVGSNTATVTLANSAALSGDTPVPHANNVAALLTVGDKILVGNSTIGEQYIKITAVGSIAVANSGGVNSGIATFTLSLEDPLKLSTAIDSNTVNRYWEFYNQVQAAPGTSDYVTSYGNTSANDEVHVVISDEDGEIAGVPGAVLEVFEGVSRATDAKTPTGETNYIKTVLNSQSEFVWYASDRTSAVSNTALNIASSTNSLPLTQSFVGGADGSAEGVVAFVDLANAYDLFKTQDDISLVLTGKARGGTNGEQLANYAIDNVAELRKDCVVFVSPDKDDVVNNEGSEAADVITFRNSVRSTSYAFHDSGYKYMYDRYNDVYRWIPLNGDIAGACAYTDNVRDPWYSPAGLDRGRLRNVIRLAWNPSPAQRDALYQKQVNPVISLAGRGTVLFGDKTLLIKSSPFDRINVRRLFIVIEKAISQAAQQILFEFNDDETQSRFRGFVEPYLRDVQGRRGIENFSVVANDTNNTSAVVNGHRFIGDLFIEPKFSINNVELNFTATPSGSVAFNEIVR